MSPDTADPLGLARSCLAALADGAETFVVAMAYELALIELDALHPTHISSVGSVPISTPEELYAAARHAISDLVGPEFHALGVELCLARLETAAAAAP